MGQTTSTTSLEANCMSNTVICRNPLTSLYITMLTFMSQPTVLWTSSSLHRVLPVRNLLSSLVLTINPFEPVYTSITNKLRFLSLLRVARLRIMMTGRPWRRRLPIFGSIGHATKEIWYKFFAITNSLLRKPPIELILPQTYTVNSNSAEQREDMHHGVLLTTEFVQRVAYQLVWYSRWYCHLHCRTLSRLAVQEILLNYLV